MRYFALAVGLSSLGSVANAHSVFTTLFVNGVGQGDGTCVRMPKNMQTNTSPLEDLTSPDLACGK